MAHPWHFVEYVPLREQIRDELRRRITYGELVPGERLVELTLAAELGVSRVPVREAMRLLEVEGFVEVLPRRGAVVRQLSRQDVENLFELRLALEGLACELAATRGTPEQMSRLCACVTDAKKTIMSGGAENATTMSAQFHDTVVEMTGNQLLTSTLAPLSGRIRWLLQKNNDPVLMCEEHQRIYRAIAERNVKLAGSLGREHVLRSRRVTMALLFGDADAKDASACC